MPEVTSNIFRGGMMIVGSMAIIGLIDNFIRFVAMEAGVWQFYFVRALVAVPLIIGFSLWKKQSLMPIRFWAVAVRSILLSAAILIYFSSLSVMRIAEAGATLFSSPIFLLIFSALLFRMRIGIWRIGAVLVGFTGVVLVLKPDVTHLNLFVLVPLFAGIMYALGQLVTRHWCSEESTIAVLLGFFLACAFLGLVGMTVIEFAGFDEARVQSAPFIFTGWVELTPSFWFWTTIQCFGSLVGVYGLIRGYQIAEPTYVGVFEYSFLVFAGFWGWVIWNEVPDKFSLIGIVLIIMAGIVITLRSRA